MGDVVDPRQLPDDGLSQSSMAWELPPSGSAQGSGPRYADAAETHVGAVFFLGDRAYKFKKPVDLGFLDFRETSTRAWACRREYELNRRLAPDVYLDVAELRGRDGTVHDHVVVMRRMPPERSLAALVESGRPDVNAVRETARLLAEMHARGPRSPEISGGGQQALLDKWNSDIEALNEYSGTLLDEDRVRELAELSTEYLAGRGSLLEERVADGWIVDGHGDLLSEDIFCLDDGPRILDCIEFDDQLRHIDGADDASCLAMDLRYRGAPDLADRFLAWYREFSGDPAPASLLEHYTAYRALVRTKVACLKADQQGGSAALDAQQHLDIAVDRARRARVRLVLVGGLPGTGKSTLSEELAEGLGASVISSDQVRTELFGEAGQKGGAYQAGAYSPDNVDRTYAAMLDRASDLLAGGQSVVLDASWTSQRHRRPASEAAEHARAELVSFQCTAPDAVVGERLRTRSNTLSDADENISAAMAADMDAWPEAHTVATDQDRASAQALNTVLAPREHQNPA